MSFPSGLVGLALLQHQRRLASRFAGRLGRCDAEDLASEAVARGLHHPAPDGRQAPWIERIFRNLVVDRGRRRARRGAIEAPVPMGIEPPSSSAGPEEALLRSERTRALDAVLPTIPPELREAVMARFYDERDYDEMALASGISAATARTRVHRALARLRRQLAGLGAFLPVSGGGGVLSSSASALLPAALAAAFVIAPVPIAGPTVAGRDRTVTVLARTAGHGGARAARPAAPVPSSAPSWAPAAAMLDGSVLNDTLVRSGGSARRVSVARAVASPAARPAPSSDDAPTPSSGDASSQAPAVQHMKFDPDEVEGTLRRPGTIVVEGDPAHARFGTLIEIPASFEPSMTKMIEDL